MLLPLMWFIVFKIVAVVVLQKYMIFKKMQFHSFYADFNAKRQEGDDQLTRRPKLKSIITVLSIILVPRKPTIISDVCAWWVILTAGFHVLHRFLTRWVAER